MRMDAPVAGIVKNTSLDTYRKAKLKMMKRDFKIELTDEEIAYANTLTTEVKIDQFCLSVIERHWG